MSRGMSRKKKERFNYPSQLWQSKRTGARQNVVDQRLSGQTHMNIIAYGHAHAGSDTLKAACANS